MTTATKEAVPVDKTFDMQAMTNIQSLIAEHAKGARAKQILGAAKSLGISQRKLFAALKADGASPDEVANWYLLWVDA